VALATAARRRPPEALGMPAKSGTPLAHVRARAPVPPQSLKLMKPFPSIIGPILY
jgi:hypothetical protein